MTDEINFTVLQARFNRIKESYSAENHKYLHITTIANFLTHADSFAMQHHKEETNTTLTKYFDEIDTRKNDNIHESLKLFNTYLMPLANLFKAFNGFHMTGRFWFLLFWPLPIFVLLYLIDASWYYSLGLFAVSMLIAARHVYFKRKQKTFGFLH